MAIEFTDEALLRHKYGPRDRPPFGWPNRWPPVEQRDPALPPTRFSSPRARAYEDHVIRWARTSLAENYRRAIADGVPVREALRAAFEQMAARETWIDGPARRAAEREAARRSA